MPKLSDFRKTKQTQQKTMGLDSSGVLSLSGSGIFVYETLDSLPSSNLVEGSKAIVNDVKRLYLSDGNGWYNTGFNIQYNPRWLIEPDDAYYIADSATPLLVTAKAADSDNPNLINQSFASDSAQYMVTISNDSSVWTFTPKSADSIGIEVASGNLNDSNGDFIYTFKWSDGINVLSKQVTITYATGASLGTGLYALYLGGYYTGAGQPYGQTQVSRTTILTQSSASSVGNLSYGAGLMGATGEPNGYRAMTWGGKVASQSNTDKVSLYNTTTDTAAGWGLDLHTGADARQGIMCVSDDTYAYAYGGERWTEYSYNNSRKKSWASSTTSTHTHTLIQKRNRAGLETNGTYTIMAGGMEGGGTAGLTVYYTSIEHWTNATSTTATSWGNLGFVSENKSFTNSTLYFQIKGSAATTQVYSVSYTSSGNAVLYTDTTTASDNGGGTTSDGVVGITGSASGQSFYNMSTGAWTISGTGGPYGSMNMACTGS